ncbi:DUF1269 domain-containing protein [Streptomyces sp. NPDC060002]|uniref:DUF1269 domain-containing protein n=1 Tax=Streptomyces sp. NPDC060002 TaxID=3347033 RepID=UPI0036BCDE6D
MNDTFMKNLSQNLRPGAAGLFVLVKHAAEDKVIPATHPVRRPVAAALAEQGRGGPPPRGDQGGPGGTRPRVRPMSE